MRVVCTAFGPTPRQRPLTGVTGTKELRAEVPAVEVKHSHFADIRRNPCQERIGEKGGLRNARTGGKESIVQGPCPHM